MLASLERCSGIASTSGDLHLPRLQKYGRPTFQNIPKRRLLGSFIAGTQDLRHCGCTLHKHRSRPLFSQPRSIGRAFGPNHVLRVQASVPDGSSRRGSQIKQHALGIKEKVTPTSDAAANGVPSLAKEGFRIDNSQLATLVEAGDQHPMLRGVVTSMEDLQDALLTSLTRGLSDADAADLELRARTFGRNALPERKEVSFWELALNALKDPTVLVLCACGTLSIGLELAFNKENDNGWIEGAAILLAVVVVVLVTAVNDFQKEQQFRQLSQLSAESNVTVLRDGRTLEVSSSEVVVGDVLCIDTGDILPVDGLLIEGSDVKVDESQMTGESDDVSKGPLAPIMLSGSKVVEGQGRMLVTAVGPNSQSGQIFAALQSSGREGDDVDRLREKTPLENKLEVLASQIGKFGLAAALLSLGAMAGQFSWDMFVVQGRPWEWGFLISYLDFLITSITIVVVAVPEGLPLAVTIALAYSVKRMLTDNNLVRNLSAAETMGCATTICTDKTGTLTQNEMVTTRLWVAGYDRRNLGELRRPQDVPVLASLGEAEGNMIDFVIPLGLDPRVYNLLCNSVALNSTANLRPPKDESLHMVKVGNRTECALLALTESLGADYEAIRENTQTLRVFPFTSDRKRMTSVTRYPSGDVDGVFCVRVYTKGAAELVLGLCNRRLSEDSSVVPLTKRESRDLLTSFSEDGHRMIALAYQESFFSAEALEDIDSLTDKDFEGDLVLVAIMGIEDPLRPEVVTAVAQCLRAGISVKMLTGDNAVTAGMIAQQSGILPPTQQYAPVPSAPAAESPQAWAAESIDELFAEDGGSTRQPSTSATMSESEASGSNSLNGAGEPQGNGADPHRSLKRSLSREASARLVPEAHPLNLTPRDGGGAEGPEESGNGGPPPAGPAARGPAGSADLQRTESVSGRPWGWAEGDGRQVMTGAEFRKRVQGPDGKLDRAAFNAVWADLKVLARCNPQDKYLIVKALQSDPETVVAMTGDGTNDAPALRLADVGFAMNSGTSIAKEAADILLLDNNFNSIVSAVKWGRNVYAGITKFLQFQLVVNVVAVVTACAGAVALRESPLTAVQMLWVNLIMDSLASLALATDSPTDAMLDLQPYRVRDSLLTPVVLKGIIGQSIFQLAVMYALVFHGDDLFGVPNGSLMAGPSQHYTLVFNAFVLLQLFNQVNVRKIYDEANILDGILDNKLFLYILAGEVALQVIIVEFGGEAFGTVPLSLEQWGACVGIGALSLVVRAFLRFLPPHPDGKLS